MKVFTHTLIAFSILSLIAFPAYSCFEGLTAFIKFGCKSLNLQTEEIIAAEKKSELAIAQSRYSPSLPLPAQAALAGQLVDTLRAQVEFLDLQLTLAIETSKKYEAQLALEKQRSEDIQNVQIAQIKRLTQALERREDLYKNLHAARKASAEHYETAIKKADELYTFNQNLAAVRKKAAEAFQAKKAEELVGADCMAAHHTIRSAATSITLSQLH